MTDTTKKAIMLWFLVFFMLVGFPLSLWLALHLGAFFGEAVRGVTKIGPQ